MGANPTQTKEKNMHLTWESRPEDYFAVDIETDGLDPTVIWVMCWENIRTRQTGRCIGHQEIKSFFEKTEGSVYVGHNIIKYDAPVINRLVGTRLTPSRVCDTLVLSTLYNPSLKEGHSLSAWGQRIGYEKLAFSDWTKLSGDMITYCHRDAEITAELFRKITKVLSRVGFSELSCYIQHNITAILSRQETNGFYFDGQKALVFLQQLRNREEELKEQIHNVFTPERVLVRERNIYTKQKEFTALYERDRQSFEIEISGDGQRYSAFERVPFNIGSPKQRAEKLAALGWVADERTPKGFPKPTEKSLVRFSEASGIDEVALITRWLSVNGRANMVNNWLEAWNEQDSCIHGRLFVADTLRFRHQAPNTANVPAVRVSEEGVVLRGESGYFTYEARDLWTARPGRVLVGTDAAGLELRMLAHYLNRPDFTEQVVSGDPHQYNADLAGVTRPRAKTLLYAIQYGAQGGKVAQIIEGTREEGAAMRQKFLDRLGLTGVMNDAVHEQKTGRVWLVDQSGVVCPSPHAALNYKLQGGGARVMALGAIFLEKHIRRSGLDSLKVGDIHDEWQYDVAPRDAGEHARLSVQAIREAGEELNLNVPLDGTAKEGLTWAATH
jgi:DNA polymerase I